MMPKDRLRNIAEGIFFSLLAYGIQVYGGVWGLDSHSLVNGRSKAFTKKDNRQLQVIMNKVLRALTGLDKETPVNILLKQSGHLSVQQLTAYHTLSTMYKTMHNKEPVYLNSMIDQNRAMLDKTRLQSAFHPRYNLSTSRQSFMYRGQKLYNLLPATISTSRDIHSFKRSVKTWIKLNIPALLP